MRKLALLRVVPLICVTAGTLSAQEPAPSRVTVPGTGHEIVVGAPAFGPDGARRDTLLNAIVTWISAELSLPPAAALPKIELVPATQITAFRHHGFSLRQMETGAPDWIQRREVVALYDDATQTMYLRQDWTGANPEDLSVLVHEMVHHLQKLAGSSYECPQARERPAYEAQDKWLHLFGHDLAEDFGIDPFTLVAITGCFY